MSSAFRLHLLYTAGSVPSKRSSLTLSSSLVAAVIESSAPLPPVQLQGQLQGQLQDVHHLIHDWTLKQDDFQAAKEEVARQVWETFVSRAYGSYGL
eukprot:s1176_g5.t1